MSTPSKSPKTKGKGHVCVFCEQGDVSEEIYGKFLSKAGVTAHYFCMLFSSGLSQNGKSEKQGILGFLQSDILKEVKRGTRLRCSYCRKIGATIGCVIRNCKKMFHLGCGRNNSTLHQFFGTFSSFCPAHRQQQDVPSDNDPNIVCSICMNTVTACPSHDTIRAPCCSKYWYHRECVQRYATSAGLYFFKCPLCNNKDEFQNEMLTMGIYIPDQDASWEKEPHAFQELLERYGNCDAPVCKCAEGRKYDKEGSKWEIILCDFCGSHGSHVACNHLEKLGKHDVCRSCKEVDERTREEEYLLHSPPSKRKSLEFLQLQLASSPETSKGASPYPGPSNSMKKISLPNSPTEKNVRTKSGDRKRKRMSTTEVKSRPPKLQCRKRSISATATVSSASQATVMSPNTSTSSQSSDDSSDEEKLSTLKLKMKKMELENAWDVRRRKKRESKRKQKEKKEKFSKTEIKSDSDEEVLSKVKNRSRNVSLNDLCNDTDVGTANENDMQKNRLSLAETKVEKGLKNGMKKSSYLRMSLDTSTSAVQKKKSLKLQKRSFDTASYVNTATEIPCKTDVPAVTEVNKEEVKSGMKSSLSKRSSSTVSQAGLHNDVEKKTHGKLKKRSLENDKTQTTLMDWFKPKPKYEESCSGLSLNGKSPIDTKRHSKRTVTIEWKGKQLLIRSPRVVLNRSRNRKNTSIKPKCLEIDMNDRKGSLDWSTDVDLLSKLETDVRVTRKMIDIDHENTNIETKSEKSETCSSVEEYTETKLTALKNTNNLNTINTTCHQSAQNETNMMLETELNEKVDSNYNNQPNSPCFQGDIRKNIKKMPKSLKCLEIDMVNSCNKDTAFLFNLQTDARVTRKMIDKDPIQTKISPRKKNAVGRYLSPVRNVLLGKKDEVKMTAESTPGNKNKLFPEQFYTNSSGKKLKTNEAIQSIEKEVKANADTVSCSKVIDVVHDNLKENSENFDTRRKLVTKKVDDQFGNVKEDSPAKNLRNRKAKGNPTGARNILNGIPGSSSPDQKNAAAESKIPQSEKSVVENNLTAENYKANIGKAVLETDNTCIQESEHTPKSQKMRCFNFTIVKEKNSSEKGSPLNCVKESAGFESDSQGSDTKVTNVHKGSDTEVTSKINEDNIERLKLYKPVLPALLDDSPAKNLRRRSHQIKGLSEEKTIAAVNVKEVFKRKQLEKEKETENFRIKEYTELEAQTNDSDNSDNNSFKSDRLERLKKYKPKVLCLNSSNTDDVKLRQSERIVKGTKKEEAKTAFDSESKKKKKEVIWHLEGTRQLENDTIYNNSNICAANCENTCPNSWPTVKDVHHILEEEHKTNATKRLDRCKEINIQDFPCKNQTEKISEFPSHKCLTKHGQNNNVESSNNSNLYKSCKESENRALFSSKGLSTNNSSIVKSATESQLQEDRTQTVHKTWKNKEIDIENTSRSVRSSPRPMKKASVSEAASQFVASPVSDKTSMAEYYGAGVGCDINYNENDPSGRVLDADDDDDIVELQLFTATSSIA